MSELRIETSKPAPSPVINAWLNPSPKGFELVLKHSGDTQEQRLFFFDLRDSTIGVSVQGLFAANLCKAFGIEKGATPTILPWGSHLAPSEADKLPSGVAEALGPERDWADELADAIWPHSAGPRNLSVPVIANIIRKSRCRPIGNDTVTDELVEAAKLAFEFAQAVNNLLTPLKSEWQQAGMWTEYDEKVLQMRPQVTLALGAALAKQATQ